MVTCSPSVIDISGGGRVSHFSWFVFNQEDAMKLNRPPFLIQRLFFFFPLLIFLPALYGQIESVTRLTATPRRFEQVDFVVMLTGTWTNPYCQEEVHLDLELATPGGAALTMPAYYEQGHSRTLSVWKARFTPGETGKYSGIFVLTSEGKRHPSSNITFDVAASNHKGFLRPATDWGFRFDNGEPFRGLGENVGWESRDQDDSSYFAELHENPRYNYEYLLGQLAMHGGNFFRTWMCPWNLPLEWKQVSNNRRYRNDSSHFNSSAIERMDRLVDLADSLDLYFMLAFDNSGNFLGKNWKASNYNLQNGGPVAEGVGFFTDPQAKTQYKDRLRYIVARWGYSPHIAAWEFFNEIDNFMYGLPQTMPDPIATAWHSEMSEYLKNLDPNRHLVTTSISHRDVAGLNQVKSMDCNQRHIYRQTATIPEVVRRYARQEGKPYVIGEFAFEWDWSKNFNDMALDMDRDFKKGLWLGLFSPTPILPLTWWWEFFDQRGLTPYYACVRLMLDRMLAAGHGSFADVECRWEGGEAQVLAVRCGKTLFVLLSNSGAGPADGSISLPLETVRHYEISYYNPEQNTIVVLPSPAKGSNKVEGIIIPPASETILTVSPKK
jgi:hypothetical protein